MANHDQASRETQREVLQCIADEGRVNSRLLSERTSLEENTIETTLEKLVAAGSIQRVTQDLYEIDRTVETTTKGDAEHHGIPDPNPDTQTAPIDPNDVDDKP